ncbi:MAG: hypothetical protein AB1454_06065 [Candidatus Auribacterota bacterium]
MADKNSYYQPGLFGDHPDSSAETSSSAKKKRDVPETTRTLFTLNSGDKSIRLSFVDNSDAEQAYTQATHSILKKTVSSLSDKP